MSAIDQIIDEWEEYTMSESTVARAELSHLRATLASQAAQLQAAQARIAELESTIALNKYVTPPFDVTDDDTARLALQCAEKDRRIAELEQALAAASARENDLRF